MELPGLSPSTRNQKWQWIGLLSWFLSLGMFLGALAMALILAGDLYEYSDTLTDAKASPLPAVDAVVCLTGGRGRISVASQIWLRYHANPSGKGRRTNDTQGSAPLFYVSGVGPGVQWSSFQKHLPHDVQSVIKREDVLLEDESTTTDTNARTLSRYAKGRHWQSVLLVTSAYHMKRARFLIEKVLAADGVHVQVATHSVNLETFEPQQWRSTPQGVRVTLIEYLKWIYTKHFWEV